MINLLVAIANSISMGVHFYFYMKEGSLLNLVVGIVATILATFFWSLVFKPVEKPVKKSGYRRTVDVKYDGLYYKVYDGDRLVFKDVDMTTALEKADDILEEEILIKRFDRK